MLILIAIVTGIAAVVFLCISYFTFLGFTNAYKNDDSLVCAIFKDFNDNNTPCQKFIGDDSNDGTKYTWGAGMLVVLRSSNIFSIFCSFRFSSIPRNSSLDSLLD